MVRTSKNLPAATRQDHPCLRQYDRVAGASRQAIGASVVNLDARWVVNSRISVTPPGWSTYSAGSPKGRRAAGRRAPAREFTAPPGHLPGTINVPPGDLAERTVDLARARAAGRSVVRALSGLPLRGVVAGTRQPIQPPAGTGRCVLDQPYRCAPWRNLPEEFGNWNSLWRQFRRWCQSGVWDALLRGLADSGIKLEALQMINSTTIRAHRCVAGETGEVQFQALGRSRSGFTTKFHIRCNAAGKFLSVSY